MTLKVLIALVVLAHGIGHILFLGPSLQLAGWAGQTGHSWALTSGLGDGPTRAIAALLWSATIVLFVAGVGGFLLGQPWWVGVTAAGAVTSIVGIVLMWDGIVASSAGFALAFDVLVLVSLFWAHWPTTEMAGS